jgi:tetratricopeptide (TPR) repeat protein
MTHSVQSPTLADHSQDAGGDSSQNQAIVRLRLASAWKEAGRLDLARRGFEEALRLNPALAEAHVQLASLAVNAGVLDEALTHLGRAAELVGAGSVVHSYYLSLAAIKAGSVGRADAGSDEGGGLALVDQPGGKINLSNQKTFDCHRSGWNVVLDALRPFHHSRGLLFDGFIESNFAWRHWSEEVRPIQVLLQLQLDGVFDELATTAERGITPYREPWVGILHNPPNMPAWFHRKEAPQTIMAKAIWRESLPTCLGFFTFSRYHAEWLAAATHKPVSPLVFPTEIPERLFGFAAFLENRTKKIVQIGWWLRRLRAIHELPVAADNPLAYEKVRLVPRFFDGADDYLRRLMEIERRETKALVAETAVDNTQVMQHLANDAYDALLAENIAFVYLYDASANNAVVECIARGTPLLINRIPAVTEYLGDEYPFYYNDLYEAARKVQDLGCVRAAHEYLMQCDTRPKLDRWYFQQAFAQSEVYRSLPSPS